MKIHGVAGNRIVVTKASEGTTRRSGQANEASAPKNVPTGSSRRGRGKLGEKSESQQSIVEIPADTKITSAMRERRTFEFRVGAELPGGLRNQDFQDLKSPLSARIVTENGRVTQVNVITEQTDINQSNTDGKGSAVIAVRPKRPPMKK